MIMFVTDDIARRWGVVYKRTGPSILAAARSVAGSLIEAFSRSLQDVIRNCCGLSGLAHEAYRPMWSR